MHYMVVFRDLIVAVLAAELFFSFLAPRVCTRVKLARLFIRRTTLFLSDCLWDGRWFEWGIVVWLGVSGGDIRGQAAKNLKMRG